MYQLLSEDSALCNLSSRHKSRLKKRNNLWLKYLKLDRVLYRTTGAIALPHPSKTEGRISARLLFFSGWRNTDKGCPSRLQKRVRVCGTGIPCPFFAEYDNCPNGPLAQKSFKTYVFGLKNLNLYRFSPNREFFINIEPFPVVFHTNLETHILPNSLTFIL